uniref:AMP-dependent synthetase/ligase domain-containing protein n=1 Tax=Coccidioides posadasii RMSCC 3488 TaxID=454284 RepID=A0A0J6FPA1_COCPO|nr:hypothetical protein CPAG_08495 [Coccidioides posadasii RMSCC 3488]
MAPDHYSLQDILAMAMVHPFYSAAGYPPTPESASKILAAARLNKQSVLDLKRFPLTRKESLYRTIQRLSADPDPRNGYRQQAYISVTGGGSGGVPMVFVTDSVENRRQRDVTGALVKHCRLIEPGDWMLTMHIAGHFYRALDLMTEIAEQAGAGVFCAGIYMPYADVVKALIQYRINVVAADGSQIVQLAAYISSLPPEEREGINVDKVLYTSEPLVRTQRAFIRSVMGPVTICSILGSSEAGTWAVANLDLTGDTDDDCTEFIFDTRSMVIEILPLSVEDPDQSESTVSLAELPEGEAGIVVQTSLQRLRNPLVRYVSGDVGSLHPLPASALAKIPPAEAQHMKLLRLYGRDRRFSFKWSGAYFAFDQVEALMRTENYGILQWQIALSYTDGTPETALEIRIFRPDADNPKLVSTKELVAILEKFFGLLPINEMLFRVTFVQSTEELERSKTGNKVIKFVDRTMKE